MANTTQTSQQTQQPISMNTIIIVLIVGLLGIIALSFLRPGLSTISEEQRAIVAAFPLIGGVLTTIGGTIGLAALHVPISWPIIAALGVSSALAIGAGTRLVTASTTSKYGINSAEDVPNASTEARLNAYRDLAEQLNLLTSQQAITNFFEQYGGTIDAIEELEYGGTSQINYEVFGYYTNDMRAAKQHYDMGAQS